MCIIGWDQLGYVNPRQGLFLLWPSLFLLMVCLPWSRCTVTISVGGMTMHWGYSGWCGPWTPLGGRGGTEIDPTLRRIQIGLGLVTKLTDQLLVGSIIRNQIVIGRTSYGLKNSELNYQFNYNFFLILTVEIELK